MRDRVPWGLTVLLLNIAGSVTLVWAIHRLLTAANIVIEGCGS